MIWKLVIAVACDIIRFVDLECDLHSYLLLFIAYRSCFKMVLCNMLWYILIVLRKGSSTDLKSHALHPKSFEISAEILKSHMKSEIPVNV